jgi:WD40 repeat protein
VLAVIDGATGAVRRRLSGHEGPIYRVHFLPRRPLVLSASPDGTARLWDLQSGLQVSLFGGRGAEVTFARPSDDGARILTAGARVAAWATDSPQVPLTQIWGHTAEVTSAAFLAGDLVATGSADTTIRVWRLADDQVAAGWRAHEGVLWDASLTRAGDRAVTASGDGSARVWSSTGALLHELRGHQDDVTAVALSPGGDLVASGSEDSTAIVWNARTGERLHVLRGHQAQVGDVEFSSDGATVLSSSWDGTAKLWHSRDGQLVHTLAGADGPVFAGRFHPRRPQLLTAHADGALREWDLHAGRLLATRQAHESAIFQFALSHDGRRAATASLQTVRLWDLEHWRLLGTCEGHRDLVRSIDFSPDGALLVTTGEDRSALVWNAQTCELLERRPVGEPGTAISFRGDGRQLLAANLAGLVQLWNIDYDRRSPRELAILVRCQVGLQVVDEKVVAADRRGCPP